MSEAPHSSMQSAAHLGAGVDPASVDVLAEESLPRAWVARWAEAPRAVAVIDPHGAQLTADDLEHRSRQVAGRLSARGLTSGHRIIVSAEPSLDMVTAYVAAHRLGLVVVPVNTAYGDEEIAKVVRRARPSAAVVDDRSRARAITAASPEPVLVMGTDVALGRSDQPDLDLADRSTPALICYTSGTTGEPKGALLSSGNLLASAQALRMAWRWTPEDRLALALPLFHLHGLGVGLHGTLTAGATAVLAGKFDPVAVSQAINDHRGTMFFGVPTMYHRLASAAAWDALRRLRLCVSGSAPLSADLHEQIRLGSGQDVLERYGMTETVVSLSNPYSGERRPGSVGFPLPGVEMRLVDPTGTVSETEGEIQLRGLNVFSGYFENPGATADAFTDDRWFRTGDLGAVDLDGYVSIVGRNKDLIISGGYNVYPREVEEVLLTHEGVIEAAVVGRPSEEWGETVVAVVVKDGPVDPDELMAFAAARLTSYKRPREVVFVDSLPRNELGKVRRTELLAG